MSLTARDVAEILRALEQSSFDTLDLEFNGVQIHLRRGGSAPPAVAGASLPARPASVIAPPSRPPPFAAGSGTRSDAEAVPAPLLGIFYRAPKPGEAPFVQVGDRVKADTIVGIIEVMKLMNTVRAGIDGQVVEITAGNGDLVEFSQPLLWIRRS